MLQMNWFTSVEQVRGHSTPDTANSLIHMGNPFAIYTYIYSQSAERPPTRQSPRRSRRQEAM
jgi:hypothetical protein